MLATQQVLDELLLVQNGRDPAADARQSLRKFFAVRSCTLEDLIRRGEAVSPIVVFDADSLAEDDLSTVARWRRLPIGAPVLIFIANDDMRVSLIRRGLNQDANLVRRPFAADDLSELARQLNLKAADRPRRQRFWTRESHYRQFPAQAEAMEAGDGMLDEIFGVMESRTALDARALAERSTLIIDSLKASGLPAWVKAVRAHHDRTYQHCLLVTGTLLAFGHHLRMSAPDLQRLAVGGLLHDLGKADVPLPILDKPSALTDDETAVMRTHTETGVERLKAMVGITDQLRCFVSDHHEHLDGSGYPRGLAGASIKDPVRLLTIADILAALIEKRPYKPALPSADAVAIIDSMIGKLDQAFVAALKPVMMSATEAA